MDRRTFLKGLVATAAGVLVPGHVAADPERRIWALDRTMVQSNLAWVPGTGWIDTRSMGWADMQFQEFGKIPTSVTYARTNDLGIYQSTLRHDGSKWVGEIHKDAILTHFGYQKVLTSDLEKPEYRWLLDNEEIVLSGVL
jgi:hypothetical protein